MKRLLTLLAAALVVLSFMGCSSLGFTQNPGQELHPGHPGHEVH